MIQRPDATRVAGFNTWKKLARHVVKGEKGIRIFAPMKWEMKIDDAQPGDGNPGQSESEAKRNRLYGFRVVSVFDISQTECEPLPDIGQIQGDPGQHLAQLRSLIIGGGKESGTIVMLSIPDDGVEVRPADLLSILVRLEVAVLSNLVAFSRTN